MARIIIVELLGRRIGFNVLFNKISMMWSPRNPIHPMDLENDYYLVHFQHEDDYNKVLARGPLVIFGQYLIVHPWLLMFSTSQNKVDIQVVRIRLPDLPEGYYSHFLLRAIGQAIGPIIKLDEHIDNTRRGMFARLVVCIDLKKPTPSLRNGTDHSVPIIKKDDDNLFGGFSFTSLDENHGGIESEILTHNEGVQLGNNKAQDHVTRLSRETGNFVAKNKKFPKKSIQRVKGKDIVIGNGPKTSFKALKPTNGNVGSSSKFGQDKFKDGSKMGRKASAGKEGQLSFQPVSINSNLDKDKHKAVRVFAKGSSGTTMGKENGFFLFGKKPLDSVSMISIPTKMDMTASIEGIVREIERGFGISNMEDDVPSLVKVRDDGINCTDEISGIQVDGVIAKLGFPNSFQIEANGFSGGVWVVWNENILIDILELHPQMIYMRFKV
ncbi:hypothetical protein Gohar_010249, partial [Gossypium harknessii]|nr:hypothetical protein [Gossypium harknessii]